MPTRLIEYEGRPLLDLSSYARKGPGRRDHLPAAEIELIGRTANRVPEVMVKVLTRGGQDLRAVRRHLEYLNRNGELEFEADDGQRLGGKGVEGELLDDWDLDIQEDRRRTALDARPGRSPPKLVHKVLFSMPPGTPPQKVLEAVKNFAREEFALKHRYLMVLHTDEPHPHIHMVIKAVSEHGVRLNIRKATLRAWRSEFARNLRALGVPANATERVIRGEDQPRKLDGIYRATVRGESRHMRERTSNSKDAATHAREQLEKEALTRSRRSVQLAWLGLADSLRESGNQDLASTITRYAKSLPPPRTEREWAALFTYSRFHGEQAR